MMPFRAYLSAWLVLLFFGGSVRAQFSLEREPPGPSSRKTGLVITEIMYNPRPIPNRSTNTTYEFIELFNSKPWDEDISGFSIDGSIHYAFPSNTVLRAGAYLVVARIPGLVITNYAITNVLGPWDGAGTNGLPDERGIVQLHNRLGALLLEINYQDSPPWPETADGAGHSLNLARPSYGEDDFRAWSESDSVGGSPGRADPLTHDPLASVYINEWQNHSDPVDWIELYNHGNDPVDLSGAWLSDDPRTNKFRIPDGTIIPPRGFLTWDQDQLNFQLFAGGETILFWDAAQTRVIDVIDFRGSSNNVTAGRVPDGGPITYGLATPTRGSANSGPHHYPVVINEIMYNPLSGNNDDEYIEIINRASSPADISGYEFVVGISYAFPTNSITRNMPAGAHWVVAKNPTNLMAIYTNLTASNTFGPYGGTLANGGERVLLASADYDIVGAATEKLNVPVSDVIYGDGGKWGNWSDGLGSSLELIDPEADPHHPSNWADSEDPGEALWTAIEYNGPFGETLGAVVNNRVILMLQGLGECLVDEVEVRVDGGPNIVVNGGFESGLSGWTLQGSHDFSTGEGQGFASGKSLHLRAGSRGDNQSNRILSSPFTSPIPSGATNVSIRAKARWIHGHPELLVRLHGSATEAFGRLALPRKLGTPGAVNSRRIANAGPAVYDVHHWPILPAAGEPVLVTARAIDPQGVTNMTVRYRVDPTPAYTDVTMVDDGMGGDAIARDGIYSARIPGSAAGVMVAFYVQARDALNAIGTFPQGVFPAPGFTRCWPNDAVARECVVRWGEVQLPGDFASYHLWVTAVNSNRWHTRDTQNNTPVDATFVYNNFRVIYDALPLYSGSPWHRTNATAGPAGPYRVDYEMNFPDDDALLGTTDFVLNNPGNPNLTTISDLSAVAEQTVYKIFEGMGLPNNHRRYIHFFVNGNQRSTATERSGNFIFEDSQQPNGDVTQEWFPNDPGGQLFKVEDWFEFEANGFDVAANNDGDLARRTVTLNGQQTLIPAPYRFMFRKRSVGVGASANDYSTIFALINAVSPEDNPNSATIDPDLFGSVANWEDWMRHFAVQRAVGNWDSYGWERGKNDYLYQTARGFVNMPWDIDYSLGLGRGPTEPLFASNDGRVSAMFNTPAILRAYWRAFEELVNGPFTRGVLDPFIDARVRALTNNNVNIALNAIENIKTFITERRSFLESQVASVQAPFALDIPSNFETTNNLLVITGTAPVAVKDITLNSNVYPIVWTTVSNFVIRIVIDSGVNVLEIAGRDRFGNPMPGLSSTLTANYTGPVADPTDLVISEVLYATPVAGSQFIEIHNRSSVNFDLSRWSVLGANAVFGNGSIVTNGQILVIARNKRTFQSIYGNIPVFAEFPTTLSSNGQTIALIKPQTGGDRVVNALTYEPVLPWPIVTNGVSLQLIDLSQDNSRVSNWTDDPITKATPGASNSIAGSVPVYDPIWLNEVQITTLTGPFDNFGEPSPWIELYNSGAAALSLDGYYLAQSVSNNFTQWAFPPGMTLDMGQHLIIWADAEGDQFTDGNMHTDFRLSEHGQLTLVRVFGDEPQIVDYLKWNLPGVNTSYGSSPDGQTAFRYVLHNPSAGETNHEPALRVFINEWMASNTSSLSDPAVTNAPLEYDDWFEIYNAESRAIDLSGYYLSDALGSPTKYRVPQNGQYRIAPGGFLLVWADNQVSQNRADRADLHVSFKLSASAGNILLTGPDGVTRIDTITYTQQTNDISEGRYSDGASARYFMPKWTPHGPNGIPDYNTAPVFPVIANQFVTNRQAFSVSLRASDPDSPPQTLTYVLDAGPPGSILASTTFFWRVPTNEPAGDNLVAVSVSDNGTPSRSASTSFIITVRGGPSQPPLTPGPFIGSVTAVGGQASFTIDTIPGRAYRVLYKDDLNSSAWLQLGPDFVAANATASLTDTLAAPRRFYQIRQID